MTTLDFPGTVSALLFTLGCNFCCPYCHNPELAGEAQPGDESSDLEGLFAFLRKRQGLLDGLVISGGEPCLQPDLPAFCRAVKEFNYKIKLDTNGSRPEVLQELFAAQLLDYVAMDLKAPLDEYAPFGQASETTGVSQSLTLLKSFDLPHEFRTTCAAPFVHAGNIDEMARLVGKSPWFLQKARLDDNVLRPQEPMRPLSETEMAALLEQALKFAPLTRIRA